ncbi:MAG: MBL fold metallo-hydrolase [Verrucomicrobia bacterium 21-51-4]|nr:MAG: MBL fold metallo-hydrolase [Verrucomicrobia bacterium 21-51-4]HQU08742.1 MBL fold metallo-hydrolase [Opitutales bacterium]
MHFTDLNRAEDIGSNCYLIELGPFKVLVDAGIHPKRVGMQATPQLELLSNVTLDFIILTHCHLDHVGSLPLIAARQPQATVLTTYPSQMIAPRILQNSVQVMKYQREDFDIAEYPLYTRVEIDELARRFIAVPFGKSRSYSKQGETIEITFYPAGHVVGAAGVLINYKHRKIFLTSDVLFRDQVTLSGADFPQLPCDTLILETTRGMTPPNPDRTRVSEIDRLLETIITTLNQGGACLIPVFALGRMQEIIAILYAAYKEGLLPRVPIFASGLGLALVDYFDEIARKSNLMNFRRKMLLELRVKPVRERLNPGENVQGPGIYLLSSGMVVEHTPAYLAAAAMIAYPKNSICFVGYCDPDTPGGMIQRAKPGDPAYFKTLDYTATVRAKVDRFDLSGHADRDELVAFAQEANPRAVILTHGDPDARAWFMHALQEALPTADIINPEPGKCLDI